MPCPQVHNAMLKINACKELPEAALCMAKKLRTLCEAQVAAVFLLDYSGENLVLAASDSGAGFSVKRQELSASKLDDPLCFCMQTGRACVVSLRAEDIVFASAKSIVSAKVSALSWLCASPLIAPAKRTVGGVLLAGSGRQPEDAAHIEVYSLYAAAVLQNIIQRKDMEQQLHNLKNDLVQLKGKSPVRQSGQVQMLGKSEIMQNTIRQLRQIAASPASVLITGETGTGKSLAAKMIHQKSPRAGSAFVEINCGAMPAALLESELFGHVKGAFTGADSDHAGLFRSADGGTLFLDEVAELPIKLQAVLLHVLQDKIVRPVGGLNSHPVDVRIIAATNCNLEQAVEEGRFRRDLYHRLATVIVRLPSLSERQDDIPILAGHFLNIYKKQYEKPELSISPAALKTLMNEPFPGNIRELAARIEAAVMLCELGVKELLPAQFSGSASNGQPANLSLPDYIAKQEAVFIASTMKLYGGNIQKSAVALGVPRRTLARKIDKYGLKNASAGADARL